MAIPAKSRYVPETKTALALEASKGNGNVPFGAVPFGSENANPVLQGISQAATASCFMVEVARVEAISCADVAGVASLP